MSGESEKDLFLQNVKERLVVVEYHDFSLGS